MVPMVSGVKGFHCTRKCNNSFLYLSLLGSQLKPGDVFLFIKIDLLEHDCSNLVVWMYG